LGSNLLHHHIINGEDALAPSDSRERRSAARLDVEDARFVLSGVDDEPSETARRRLGASDGLKADA
jgi:hypothetical protein